MASKAIFKNKNELVIWLVGHFNPKIRLNPHAQFNVNVPLLGMGFPTTVGAPRYKLC